MIDGIHWAMVTRVGVGDMNLVARMGQRASRKEERRQSDRRYLSG